MSNRIKTKSEITTGVRGEVLNKSWSYLRDNFHKFSEANKIKIALALTTKNIPQQFDDSARPFMMMPTITTKDGTKLEFNVGTPIDS